MTICGAPTLVVGVFKTLELLLKNSLPCSHQIDEVVEFDAGDLTFLPPRCLLMESVFHLLERSAPSPRSSHLSHVPRLLCAPKSWQCIELVRTQTRLDTCLHTRHSYYQYEPPLQARLRLLIPATATVVASLRSATFCPNAHGSKG